MLVHIVHATADGSGDVGDVDGFECVLAVGATAHAFAVRFRRRARGFAEIPGHVRVQAVRGTAVADHRVEQPAFRRAYGLLLFGSQSFVFVIRIEQPAAGDDVRFVPQQRAAAWFAVSSGATRLLVVRFDGFGHVVVDDEPHVGFVDAHAERVGGHDHGHTVGDEIALRLLSCVGAHTAMVGDGDGADIRHIRTPCGTQFGDGAVKRFGERFRFLARGAVDDAGFVRMAGDVGRHPGCFVFAWHADDVEIQVRPVETGDGDGRCVQSQNRNDVAAHAFGGGGGERGDRWTCGQSGDEFADAKI